MGKTVVFFVLLSSLLCLLVSAGPTRRESSDDVACANKHCVEHEISCICGFTATPDDRCGCAFACNVCPDNWWTPPVYWNLDLSGLVLPPLDFSGMFSGWGKK